MLAAYRGAESSLAAAAPDCHLSWALVAGIGKVESGHAYGGAVSADGTTESPILGPQLDGTGGNASIADTDGGALDHDAVWDRAVGPTQFIPTSWRTYGADGNGDGVADPDNAFDATLATGRYLCAGGTDLATASGRHDAVFRYNHSEAYVATVLRWADAYASGALPVPDTEGGIPDAVLASGDPTLAALPRSFPTTGAAAAPSGAGLLGGSPVPAGVPSASASPLAAPVLPGAVAPPAGSPALVPGTSASVPGPSSSVPGPSSGAPVLPGPPSSTPAGSSSSTPAGPSSAPGASGPRPSTPRPATTPPASTTPPSSSSTPPATTTTTSSTTTSTTPPRTASPSPAQRCTKSLPAVAKAFDVPVTELTAATDDGPKAGQVTCTVSRSGKPLVVAVAAATASAPAPAPGAGVSRTVPGDRVVLSVPPAAKVPAATATAALTKLAPAWA
nr:lytic murein transglycosylase [Actinomycetospora corticicola]